MVIKFLEQKLICAGAKFSLWLVDTIDAMRYDSYIYKFLNDFSIEYQKYTLVFWFNYEDETQKIWQVFVQSKENKWQLIKLTNPFYQVRSDEKNFSCQGDENQHHPVPLSSEIAKLLDREQLVVPD